MTGGAVFLVKKRVERIDLLPKSWIAEAARNGHGGALTPTNG